MIGSQILGYTEWAKLSFLGFSCLFFFKFGKKNKFNPFLNQKSKKIRFVKPEKFILPKCTFFGKKNFFEDILVKNMSKFLLIFYEESEFRIYF